ncbi:MAG: hypothetical protein JWM04_144 [Verrucomicrobiales bacterium]|nr:hypothetical protein [Verrucomicrobiales bacterium]
MEVSPMGEGKKSQHIIRLFPKYSGRKGAKLKSMSEQEKLDQLKKWLKDQQALVAKIKRQVSRADWSDAVPFVPGNEITSYKSNSMGVTDF